MPILRPQRRSQCAAAAAAEAARPSRHSTAQHTCTPATQPAQKNPASTKNLQAQNPAGTKPHASQRTWSGHTIAVRPSVIAAFSCSDLLTLTLPMRGVAEASQIRTTCGTSEAGGACSTAQHSDRRGTNTRQTNRDNNSSSSSNVCYLILRNTHLRNTTHTQTPESTP